MPSRKSNRVRHRSARELTKAGSKATDDDKDEGDEDARVDRENLEWEIKQTVCLAAALSML